jgi:eukaryotic-like serine/threonine-protein kinase
LSTADAAALAGALPAGSVVAGRYRVEGVLGTGGMGTVYRARHVDAGEVVALKLLHAHLVKDHQVSERFHREASILRRLRGRHLVSLLDFGQDQSGQLFMALELVEGQPLDRLVRERAPLPPDEAAQLVGGVCDALASAHVHGVVHRDLTPANVMVERDELGRPHVRVFDFGLAKALHDASSASVALTHHNMIFGTAEYMSPEQVRGEELDGRADIYAAGAILYELLTGAPPFRGQNDVITMTSHLTETAEAPSRRLGRPGVISPALDAVVLRAIAKSRDDRFATAHALRDAIFQALRPDRASALSANPPSSAPRAPSPSMLGSDTMLAAPVYHDNTALAPLPDFSETTASSDTMLAAPPAPVIVSPPPSQGTVDPFTTTMTLQTTPAAMGVPPGTGAGMGAGMGMGTGTGTGTGSRPAARPSASESQSRPTVVPRVPRPGAISPESLHPSTAFKPIVWVLVVLVALLLGVALGVGLTMYR